MDKVACFKHPRYNGLTPPDLSCKVCCSKYVARIRETQDALNRQAAPDRYEWVEDDMRSSSEASVKPAKFYPGSI